MNRKCIALLCVAGLAGAAFATLAATSPLEFKVKDIDGKKIDLSKYEGKVVLMVNVASKCGLSHAIAEPTSVSIHASSITPSCGHLGSRSKWGLTKTCFELKYS